MYSFRPETMWGGPVKQLELEIEGMSCGHPVAAVADAPGELPGVRSAQPVVWR